MAQRIALFGTTGSGKSTLARTIAARTGLPLVEGDELVFEPGWVLLPRSEQMRRFEPVLAEDRWVLDAVPTVTVPAVLARADLLVGLDYPRWISFGRLLRRTARRLVTRERFCNGNTESLGQTFSSDSILLWHVRTFAAKRRQMRDLERSHGLVRLGSPRETEAWLRRTFDDVADYQDRWITCDTDGITVRGYYFPWGTKRIHYADVEHVAATTMSLFRGRGRIWGAGDPRYWFHLDPSRPTKTRAFVLTLGSPVHPVLTPDDPVGFARALQAHGLTAMEIPGGGPVVA